MRPIILFRPNRTNEYELEAAHKYFTVKTQRAAIPEGSLVIGRYSVLPHYKELETDLDITGSRMINTHRQHRYIADLGNWYRDLEGITPQTWTQLEDVPLDKYPIVIKGETNSKKFQWDTHMFAPTKGSACMVRDKLQEDELLSNQSIYYRQLAFIKTYLIGYRGIPITKEFRIFVCGDKILTKAFYWSSHTEEITEEFGSAPNPNDVPDDFIHEVMERVGKNANFYVIDVAQRVNDDWIVIELNDGQQSGLSATDPDEFYRKLSEVVNNR
jgi:hypothetical protein